MTSNTVIQYFHNTMFGSSGDKYKYVFLDRDSAIKLASIINGGPASNVMFHTYELVTFEYGARRLLNGSGKCIFTGKTVNDLISVFGSIQWGKAKTVYSLANISKLEVGNDATGNPDYLIATLSNNQKLKLIVAAQSELAKLFHADRAAKYDSPTEYLTKLNEELKKHGYNYSSVAASNPASWYVSTVQGQVNAASSASYIIWGNTPAPLPAAPESIHEVEVDYDEDYDEEEVSLDHDPSIKINLVLPDKIKDRVSAYHVSSVCHSYLSASHPKLKPQLFLVVSGPHRGMVGVLSTTLNDKWMLLARLDEVQFGSREPAVLGDGDYPGEYNPSPRPSKIKIAKHQTIPVDYVRV